MLAKNLDQAIIYKVLNRCMVVRIKLEISFQNPLLPDCHLHILTGLRAVFRSCMELELLRYFVREADRIT